MANRKRYTNSRTGQRLDRRTGRFKSKAKPLGKQPTKALPTVSLDEHLAKHLDPERLAKRIALAAYRGDWGAMKMLLDAGASQEDRQRPLSYELLSIVEHKTFATLLKKAQGGRLDVNEAALLARLESLPQPDPTPVHHDASDEIEEILEVQPDELSAEQAAELDTIEPMPVMATREQGVHDPSDPALLLNQQRKEAARTEQIRSRRFNKTSWTN